MSPKQIITFRQRLLRWYSKHGRDLPWRRTSDPYAVLVSEVMLQQTQVISVIPFYRRWLERFPTFAHLAAASEDEVLHAWQGLGYYTRARNLHAAAKAVTENHQGVLPRAPELLRKLPGMGRYTSNAVACFGFGEAVPMVEANITRVLARLFNVRLSIDSGPGRELLWKLSAALVPQYNAAQFNSALMDVGATICLRTPECRICPVKTFCRASQPELLPIKKARPETVQLTESHAFFRQRGHLLLERCTNRWRGMWMLPSSERPTNAEQALYSSVFPFTHHRVALRVYSGAANDIRKRQIERRWVRITKLDSIAIPSPHRRAIIALLQN